MKFGQLFIGQHYRGRGRSVRRIDAITDGVDRSISVRKRGVTYTVISVNPLSTGGKIVGDQYKCTVEAFAEWAHDFAPRPGEAEL